MSVIQWSRKDSTRFLVLGDIALSQVGRRGGGKGNFRNLIHIKRQIIKTTKDVKNNPKSYFKSEPPMTVGIGTPGQRL